MSERDDMVEQAFHVPVLHEKPSRDKKWHCSECTFVTRAGDKAEDHAELKGHELKWY